jgi:hypothetical protein
MAQDTGVTAMPSVQSKLAPHFTGEIEDLIEDFLEEYEELVKKCELTDQEMVETVIQYVIHSECHVWKSLPGYADCDWDDFHTQLCKEYVSPTKEGQFSRQKLIECTDKYARKRMQDESNVINYHRQFNTLSKVLLDSGQITRCEHNAIFWCGFHPTDQLALHERLIAMNPSRLRGQAFDLQDVLETARAVFSGDDDFFLQEPPPQRHESDRARERRTERSIRDQRESDRDGRASGRRWARDPPSFEGQRSRVG